MDSNTFTCRDCERTLTIEDAAPDSEASDAEVCVECDEHTGPSDDLAANGARSSAGADGPHPGRVDGEDHDPRRSPGENESNGVDKTEMGHPQGAADDSPK